ncbi:T9SS type A sorting domain-containing protein [Pontibacter sp. 172403-2]|uniref:PKD domain-containing protein n=1 Tax=Pontibacter rufus TaxID=2791028 RepID=UPI0018AF855E|nr:PKD domain-containing protein [Pontibacter sp. 172403-2]MBF9254170.1 T9SS type A sorting domain-containing protein [Pontibacter sp. 172403-2]
MRTTLRFTFLFVLFYGRIFAQTGSQALNCTRTPNPALQSLQVSRMQSVESAQSQTNANRVAVIYVLPKDAPYSDAEYKAIVKVMREIQAWYQLNTGGVTFTFSYPDTVQVYRCKQETSYYQSDWWGKLLPEMQAQGQPIWKNGTVASLWVKSGNRYGLGLGAQWCDGYCGVAMAAIENFPQFNSYYSGGVGVDAWPAVPHGTMAHELGHAFGLAHPSEVPALQDVANHSVMQTHWNYPSYAPPAESPWGFLTLERQTLQANPFMQKYIKLKQIYDAVPVNLPVTGPLPRVRFDETEDDLTVKLQNKSSGASLYYWTFGDGTVSNYTSPAHTYGKAGTYTLTLRGSAKNGMMQQYRQTIRVDKKSKPIAFGRLLIYPNPSIDGRYTIFFPPLNIPLTITVLDGMGRVALEEKMAAAGGMIRLDLNNFKRGFYYVKFEVKGFALVQRVVKL